MERFISFSPRLTLKSWAISRTSLWKGSFLIRSSVLFWYLRISLSRTSRKIKKERVTIHEKNAYFSLDKKRSNAHREDEPTYGPESNSSRAVTVRLLHTSGGGCRLASGLGSELLPGRLPSGGFACSLLSTSHLQDKVTH